MHRVCFIVIILFSTVGCDQITKNVMRRSLPITGPLDYLDNHLRLEYAENPGAFLNLGAAFSSQLRFWIFCFGVTLSLIGLTLYLFKSISKLRMPTLLGLSLILGGGIGNLVDRFVFGHVTDFIFIQWGFLRSGIFNVADVVIVTGGFILVSSHFAKPLGFKGVST
jgi:signal peptidase II